MVNFKRIPIKPCGGGGSNFPLAEKSIRFARHGCANRPFYHIVVLMKRRHQHEQPIEQIGSYDPMPNQYNEKLVAINFERLQYWMAQRTTLSKPIASLLGLAGYLPIHPSTYHKAWLRRKARINEMEQEQNEKKPDEVQT